MADSKAAQEAVEGLNGTEYTCEATTTTLVCTLKEPVCISPSSLCLRTGIGVAMHNGVWPGRPVLVYLSLVTTACHSTVGWKVGGHWRGSNGGWKCRGRLQIESGVMGPLHLGAFDPPPHGRGCPFPPVKHL